VNDDESDPNGDTTLSGPVQDHNATARPTLVSIYNSVSISSVRDPAASSRCGISATEGSAVVAFGSAYPTSDSDEDTLDDFVLRNARGRLVYIRRALLLLEEKWGTVARWPVNFGQEWVSVRTNGAQQIALWFNSIRIQVLAGRRVIRYLARVMDGELPTVDEWRMLWLEVYQLLETVYAGVLGLELRLDLAEHWVDDLQLQGGPIV
jgi:hypothetical protein